MPGSRRTSRRFEGKVVLITGASSGIGAALAMVFAEEGADLALLARREDRLEELKGRIEAAGRRAIAVRADVTRDGDVEAAVARTRAELGKIDVVVANAGFGVVGNLEKLTLDDYRRQFETNVFGVLRTIYATLGELEKQRGRLVLIGSVAGHISLPGSSAYAMSKFSVRALASAIRGELRPKGISVVLISPGFIRTEIYQVDNSGALHEGARDPLPAWVRMPADLAARKIVAAVARRRRERIITFHGRLAVAIERFLPWILRLATRGGARGRPEPRREEGVSGGRTGGRTGGQNE